MSSTHEMRQVHASNFLASTTSQSESSDCPISHSLPSSSSLKSTTNIPRPIIVGASYSHAQAAKFHDFSHRSSPPTTATSSGSGFTSNFPFSGNSPSISSTAGLGFNATNSLRSIDLTSRSSPSLASPSATQPVDSITSLSPDVLFDDIGHDEFGLPSLTNSHTSSRQKLTTSSLASSAPFTIPSYPNIFGLSLKSPSSISTPLPTPTSLSLTTKQSTSSSPFLPNVNSNITHSIGPSKPVIKPEYTDILHDPTNSLHFIPYNTFSTSDSLIVSRINKFKCILQATTIDISQLRALAWSGIPPQIRAFAWQVLLGYLTTSSHRRVATLRRKRSEYASWAQQAFESMNSSDQSFSSTSSVSSTPLVLSTSNSISSPSTSSPSRRLDHAIWHQISIDIPRTNPHLSLYSYPATQRSLQRILYVWAIRHPASGYVQGINDLVTPFWQVFLASYTTNPNIESDFDPALLPQNVLDAVEADSFWCLTKLLDGIQDNFIFAQPGIQRQVNQLKGLITRIDSSLAKHLEAQNVEFIQFSFRWMNCLLMREISLRNTIRMWDTYLAEERGFSDFHLYVCAAFLVKWSAQLLHMDFQSIMMFLQALPTKDWCERDIELLLSEAFILKSLFRESRAHLRLA